MVETIRFGTDGWRGVLADDFTDENLLKAVRGIAGYLLEEYRGKKVKVAVGYDCRFGSERFARLVTEYLSDYGIQVLLSSRVCPTPAVAWTVRKQKLQGGIILTASHNPYRYHGVKFRPSYGGTATDDIIHIIEGYIHAEKEPRKGRRGKASWSYHDFMPPYLQSLLTHIERPALLRRKLRIVVDFMHGVLTGFLESLLKGTPLEILTIRGARNPLFGGVTPEPVLPNLQLLSDTVVHSQADFGVAFDGDGDRLAIMDETGSLMSVQELLPFILQHLCERGHSGGVGRTLPTSLWVDRVSRSYHCPLFETPVGFKHLSALMQEEKIFIGGEESGGIGYAFHIPERDALLSFLFFLERFVSSDRPLSALRAEFQKQFGTLYYRRKDLPISSHQGHHLLQRYRTHLLERLQARYPQLLLNTTDGLKFTLSPEAWLMLRESGTEPLIRIYAESASTQELEELLGMTEEWLLQILPGR